MKVLRLLEVKGQQEVQFLNELVFNVLVLLYSATFLYIILM